MKNLYCLFFVLLATQVCLAQWFGQSPSPQGNNLSSVVIINENTIAAAGGDGAVLKSIDGGNSWQCKPVENKYQINQIKFLDELNGFISAYEYEYIFGTNEQYYGIILKTNDGGNNWTLKYRSSTLIGNIFFLNESVGWALADSGRVFKTIDGGNNWDEKYCGYQSTLRDIYFLDELNGWMISSSGDGGVFKTTDGGESWIVFNPLSNSNFYSMSFISNTTGWVCSSGMFKTTNGGQSWSQLDSTAGTSWWTYIQFVNENIGWCYQHDNMTASNNLLKSIDGGTSWTIQNTNVSDEIISADFLNTNLGCAVGTSGMIITTTNGGNDWINHTTKLNLVLHKVDFPSLNVGYIIARKGSGFTSTYFVLKSNDGGENWVVSDSLPNSWFIDLHFVNELKGWIVGVDFANSNGFIRNTSNGGDNFLTQYISQGLGISSIYFSDELNGWASFASGGDLLFTSDGGVNWIIKNTGYSFSPKEIYFLNNNTGWIAGYISSSLEAKVIKTTDGGSTWLDVSPPNTWDIIFDIDFVSDQKGWIAGEHGKVFKTTDGGLTWTRIWQDNYPAFTSVDFVSENTGWILTDELLMGDESALFYTSNGGNSWDFQAKLNGTKGSIFMFDQNTGWYVGGHSVSGDPQVGYVYKTTNGGISFIEETQIDEIPTEFLLSQNYPNPFNPSTTLRYVIPQGSKVVIKVFDVLGNEIATLMDEEKSVGTYELTWNAANLPSGIYFYQLRSENFIETKKMILLK
jgi:photosystem II stability/assembly factor-like uncharacterized protein